MSEENKVYYIGPSEEDVLYQAYKAACIKHENLTKIINDALNLSQMPTCFQERDVAAAEMRLAEKRLYLKIVGGA